MRSFDFPRFYRYQICFWDHLIFWIFRGLFAWLRFLSISLMFWMVSSSRFTSSRKGYMLVHFFWFELFDRWNLYVFCLVILIVISCELNSFLSIINLILFLLRVWIQCLSWRRVLNLLLVLQNFIFWSYSMHRVGLLQHNSFLFLTWRRRFFE